MVHRILVAVWAALFLFGARLPEAQAFCRTTTCSSKNPPAECGGPDALRDASTGCLIVGKPLFWDEPCVSFSVQRDGSSILSLDYDVAEPIIARAFAAWPDAACGSGFPSITATSLGPVECDRREFNSTGPNANAVIFRDEGWPHDQRAIALTTVSFDRNSGQIFGADIEINTEYYPLSDQSLEYVVLHEAGHFFGIDHSPDTQAVMYADYSRQGTEDPSEDLTLAPDDIDAICAIYPPSRRTAVACNPEPARGYAVDCGGNVIGSCAVRRSFPGQQNGPFLPSALACAAALVAFRRRARRHPSRFS